MTAAEVIALLELAPHPEGGWYRQTWIAPSAEAARPAGTCIYFLLEAGTHSHWHRVDATEIWHHYAGAPLTLRMAASAEGPAQAQTLGPDLSQGQRPQLIVPEHHWQAAQAFDTGWSLVGCTVSPAFEFAGFELAPQNFDIP